MGWQWGKKTFCVVSGASRGIGREISIQFSSKFASGSVILLTSRDRTGLESTKQAILEVAPQVTVFIFEADFSNPLTEVFPKAIGTALAGSEAAHFEQAIIVHNAGTLEYKYVVELNDVQHLQKYFNINVISPIALNAAFLNAFNDEQKAERLVINISSLMAILPSRQSSLYCTGKAARDMFFKTCAAEDPSLLVLNYAPGPVITDMWTQVETECTDPVSKAKTSTSPLQPSYSISKLVTLLEQAAFTSGDHIDVYDIK